MKLGAIAALCLLPALALPATAAEPARHKGDIIRELEVLSTVPAWGGQTPPGAAGPYEVITGVVHGALDPDTPRNAGIVDLRLAPRAADGRVDYRTDVVILRPVHAADARRLLFYDVANRGRKLGLDWFVGPGSLTGPTPPPAAIPSLLRLGATIVWSGWQGDIPLSANPATAAAAPLGTDFPVVRAPGGAPVTGMSREEFIPDYAGGAANHIALSYPPADPSDRAGVTFTARQSWLDGYRVTDTGAGPGPETYDAPSAPVTDWNYADDGHGHTTVAFTPPAQVPGPDGKSVQADAGTIYSFVYRARDPHVYGIAFAAIRDLVDFLRHDRADAAGHPNPIADLAAAGCVRADCRHDAGTVDLAIGEGISQSGRLLRDFLYQGFNADGAGRPVFDAMMPIIPGGRRTWVNARFAQPGRWSKEHEDHWQPGDQFPFAYNAVTDPLTRRRDGLLLRCQASHTCPRVMQVDGEFEWWGGRASLVTTDLAGHDLTLPPNVRYYLVAGTKHGGGNGIGDGTIARPATSDACALPDSPIAEAPVARALVPALVDWVAHDVAPPPSAAPRIDDGTAVPPALAASRFPGLATIVVPIGAAATPAALSVAGPGPVNQIAVTDYVDAIPHPDPARRYDLRVPATDADGNAVAGIRTPPVAVPLATYVGWNPRAIRHAVGESCLYNGSAIPFAVSDAAKQGGNDPRPSLATRYAGRADYLRQVTTVAADLAARRLLLPADAAAYAVEATRVAPALIPKP